MGTRMTRIERIKADQALIRGYPPDPRHPRSYNGRWMMELLFNQLGYLRCLNFVSILPIINIMLNGAQRNPFFSFFLPAQVKQFLESRRKALLHNPVHVVCYFGYFNFATKLGHLFQRMAFLYNKY
jgi:hypothetical protein